MTRSPHAFAFRILLRDLDGTQADRRPDHRPPRGGGRPDRRAASFCPTPRKNKPQRGTVLAVGPGKLKKDGTRAAMQVKAGDTVLFTSWAGDEFKDRQAKVEGEILVMREGDVMCVIE